MHRTHDALRGLSALGATLAFVVGLPLGLALVVGNPLPTSIPTWDALRVGFERSSVQREVVVNVLALLLWAVWARGTLALVTEAIAAWRGRAIELVPTSVAPRAIAARAITSITLLTVLLPGRVSVAAPLSPTVQPAAVATTAAVEDHSALVPARPAPSAPAPTSVAAGTYTVGPRDTWWSVAEAVLDDGLRWREVRDLNVGHIMADGHVVQATDEQLLEGWQVLIPAAGAVAVFTAQSPSNHVVVEPGDTLWHIAEYELGDPFQWPELYEANADVIQPTGGALRDPDLIQPGWHLSIPGQDATPARPSVPATPSPASSSPETPASPAADAPAAAAAQPEAAPSAGGAAEAANTAATAPPRRERPLRAPGRTAPSVPPVQAPRPPHDVATGPAADRSAAAPGGLAAMAASAVAKLAVIGVPALVATGVIVRLGLLRRLQLRRRTPERSLPEPDPGLEPLERRLRAIAPDEVAEWVELTLRLLSLRISQARYEVVPKVVVVRAGEYGIEVLLDQPCSPEPEGFEVDDDARVWRVAADMEIDVLRDLVAGAPVISPALVTLGMSPEGPVLVDLETLGVLSVEGDEDRVRSFLAGVALQLATASWSELELAVLEDDLGVAALERGPSCTDVEELVKRVATSARGTAGALDGLASTTAARVAEADADPWAPVVAVVGPAHREEAVDQVVRVLGAPGRGGALVAAGPVRDATWRLSISAAGQAVLSPLGLEVDISAVDSDAVVGCSQLLEVAAEEGDNAPLVDLVTESARHQAAVEGGSVDESVMLGQQRLLEPPGPEDVVVRVLGRPEVIGWDSLAGTRSTEIVVYIAVHDDPVPTERFRDAMWPLGTRETSPDEDGVKVAPSWTEPVEPVGQQTVKSALWRARRALGFDAEGRAHLPPTKGGLLGPLGPGVRCDWSEFRSLVALSQRQPRHEAIGSLRAALERVRGAPFSYVAEGTYGWSSSERIASNIEIAIGDAAHRLCRWALEQGDDEMAMWATHQGLLASPGQEALYRDRMEAAAASGDATRLRKVLSDAQQAVRSIDPLDDLSQETVALYEHLSTKLEHRGA